mmetsp:Transcript_36049/g.89954  ORF Transcript_36049/g.89954 Transcript_36049/m.89954 type:complete len:290 (-) Transcript_36049:125-994(-)
MRSVPRSSAMVQVGPSGCISRHDGTALLSMSIDASCSVIFSESFLALPERSVCSSATRRRRSRLSGSSRRCRGAWCAEDPELAPAPFRPLPPPPPLPSKKPLRSSSSSYPPSYPCDPDGGSNKLREKCSQLQAKIRDLGSGECECCAEAWAPPKAPELSNTPPRRPPPPPPPLTSAARGDSASVPEAKGGGKDGCSLPCREPRARSGTLAVLVRFIFESGDMRRRALVERCNPLMVPRPSPPGESISPPPPPPGPGLKIEPPPPWPGRGEPRIRDAALVNFWLQLAVRW